MMDEQEIRQRGIVDRYLRHELSEQEEYEFEQYYFDHPEMLKEVALAEAMCDALRASQRLQSAPPVETWTQRLLARMSTPAWRLAATAATVVMGTLLAVETLQGPGPGEQTAGLRPGSVMPVVAELELLRMRGQQAGAPPVARIEAEGALSITIDVAGMDPLSLRATLRGPRQSLDLPSLNPDPKFGVATIVMPAKDLAPGSYVLELRDAQGSNFAYRFEVAR